MLAQEVPQLLEYAFKFIMSIGVTLVVWILKDYKASLKELTENLNRLSLSLATLIQRDITREDHVKDIQKELNELKRNLHKLERAVTRVEVQRKD